MVTQSVDEGAIRQAVDDYYQGWYGADANRHAQALHAELAKRTIRQSPTGDDYLHNVTKDQMVTWTAQGKGGETPANQRSYVIVQVDYYEQIASVKVEAYEYIEYLHLAKENGKWLIVNVLWTLNKNPRL